MKLVTTGLFLLLPVTGLAQGTALRRWSLDGAAGLGFGWAQSDSRGVSYALSIGRTITRRVTLRGAAEFVSFPGKTACGQVYTVDQPDGTGQLYCVTVFGESVASVSLGADAALWQPDRGPFVSARLGVYSPATTSGPQGGAYLGTGFAFPVSFGAFTIEAGVHRFFGARRGEGWVAPVRLGMRWRP